MFQTLLSFQSKQCKKILTKLVLRKGFHVAYDCPYASLHKFIAIYLTY